jgi:hypothetical protein
MITFSRQVPIELLYNLAIIINTALHASHMHSPYSCALHAIGVPEGVTLLDNQEHNPEVKQEQEAPQVEPEGDKVMLECPQHEPATFVKGKPRSILSLLLFS